MSQRTLRQWLPGRLTEALRAEWTKLHTLPGTVLLLVGTVALTVSLSTNTVSNHIASILAKLHLENRIQAAVQAVRSGIS